MNLIKEPTISVVMAAYNAERTIEDAVRSVLSQSFQDFELVICDDASSDQTLHIIEQFSDNRLRVIKNTINCGPGPSRDRAIQAAKGSWLTILDADDQFMPNRLQTLLRIAEKHPDDLIVDDILDCHDTTKGLIPWGPVWNEKNFPPQNAEVRTVDLLHFLKQDRLLVQPFFRREFAAEIGAGHGHRRNGEDLEFLLPFFASGSVIRYVPVPMYLYRMTPGSLSTSNPDRHRIYREVFERARLLFAHDPEVVKVIEDRITSIDRLDTFQEFFRALRAADVALAWKRFKKAPWVAAEFVKRALHRIPFHIHRAVHRGKARRVE